eukprot:NODE_1509_length_1312_cov_237.318987_g1496_i0.p1 GENE.NODE_1509_length_1312_cov_237.318987_g1496_i0~~NODE_1509_length_1312_cov_237.318987_g1496_i0.p1  ORF type:complete len:425 (+),score=110.27 NODE_1509_length_1312_cov_237.318987_g1496_i0:69-1277(+)
MALRRCSSGLRLSGRKLCPGPLLLTETETSLVNSVRDFAGSFRNQVMDWDRAAAMPQSFIDSCFEQGLMGIETAEKYDGADMGFFSSILVIEELAKVDPSVSVMVDVQNTLVNNIFFRFANEEQKTKYLPRLATNTLGSFCLSEPSSGTDAFALKCRAVQDGDDYILNGAKHWITNSREAGLFLVMANVNPDAGYKGITCFVVERDNPGLTVGKAEDKLGIRSSSTCPVLLDNCRVSKDCIIGELGKGYKIAIETLNEGRIGIAAQMVGTAQGAYEAAMPYIFERKQFGQPIASFQAMQHQYADIALDIEAARLLTYNAARLKQVGQPFVKEAAMAKLHASRVAERTASKCVELMGGMGFTKDMPAEKFYRDSKIGSIYEGTSNIQLQTIAKIVGAPYANKQ